MITAAAMATDITATKNEDFRVPERITGINPGKEKT